MTPEERKEYDRKYYLANREKLLKKKKEYDQLNKDKKYLTNSEYIKNNPEKKKLYNQRYQERLRTTKIVCV
jgi:hypothetical protein